MDPRYCAQDVLRCDLCETPVPPMYCDICHVQLCLSCVGIHLSDRSKEHRVLPFEERGSTTKCQKHSNKICELHCEQCNIPICALCVSSKEHKTHEVVDILKSLKTKKEAIKRDLQELEKSIYPQYQEAASNIPVQKTDAGKHSKKLTTELKQQGEALHKEIDNAIQKMQSEIDDMDSKHLAVIEKQEDAINNAIAEITQVILDLRKLLDTSNVCLVSEYKSRNGEFRRLPAQFIATLPTFTPQAINRKQIYQQIGFLSKLAVESSLPVRPLIDGPRILREINTEYGGDNYLCSLSCLSDDEFWARGKDNIMRLYNLQGDLQKSVRTKSGYVPGDIAVTLSRDLAYTDPDDRSINIVKNTKIQPLIRLRGWIPLHLCSTYYGDLLVVMISDDEKQSKVVRYSGSTEIQSIQWDDQGKALYSPGPNSKYLSENRNFDICVADLDACAVVVVSAAGKLRFRYTGHPARTTRPRISVKPFKPVCITSDSQSRILTTDANYYLIRIIDQDGNFLCNIDNCDLQDPIGLCVDSRDKLFVAEFSTRKVKKIQYCG